MKYGLILLGLLILFVQCKRDEPKQTDVLEEKTAAYSETAGTASFASPDISEINFDDIMALQVSITRHPGDKAARRDFLGKAWYPSKAALVTIGIGRLKHPETGQLLPRPLVRRAAQLDANRWAAYGKSWIKNDLNPDFGTLDTTFQGLQTVVMTFEKGDSLYLAVANEVH